MRRQAAVLLLLLAAAPASGQSNKPAACTTLTCPTNFALKADAASRQCLKRICVADVDRDNCCNEACLAGPACPMRYLPKADIAEQRCFGECDETDVELCCDAVETCLNFTCPERYVLKPEPEQQYCRMLTCDQELDLGSCCNQICSTFTCSDRSRLKANASTTYCTGTCGSLRDRETCCDFVPGLNESGQLLRAAILSDTRRVDRLVAMRVELPPSGESSALHFAALHDNADVVGRLVDGGARLGAKDVKGWAPLHVAAGRGHVAVISMLITRRADPLQLTRDGETPRDIARQSHPVKERWPRPLETVLVQAERSRADEVVHGGAVHMPMELARHLPVQRGLRAWLAADLPGSVQVQEVRQAEGEEEARNNLVHLWKDEAGRGNDAVPVSTGEHTTPRFEGQINGLPAVRFERGELLKADGVCRCKTVALVLQHLSVTSGEEIFGQFGSSFALRLQHERRGYWPGRLSKQDWQWKQWHKVWLNGQAGAETWEGFPTSPVVVVAVKYGGRADGPDFVYQLGGGLDALVGEVLVYDRELRVEEVSRLHDYLARKWKIGLQEHGGSQRLSRHEL